MKNFINWCNQNGGFIAFWGIILMIFTWIIPSLNIPFPEILIFLKNVLSFNISIPVYGILILLIFILIILRNKIGSWNNLFIKSVIQKINDFPSNESTMFIGSPNFKQYPANKPAYVYKDGGYWNSFKQFNELNRSYWISHIPLISDEEAINGGIYFFEKKVKINYHIDKIESAVLYITVDDYCIAQINNNKTQKVGCDLNTLYQIPIKEFLIKGENIFRFEVENVSSNYAKQGNLNNRGVKNPYGIRFLIRIINK